MIKDQILYGYRMEKHIVLMPDGMETSLVL